ncbi:MAG TPA: glutaredoxin family protein [Mycobacteriales bacterium]|nr:glutaredoxin family protein [Mycobacteriales bacterium]
MTSPGSPPRVTVLVTAGCHLCEQACAVVAEVCAAAGVGWQATDLVDTSPADRARWREYVPVVLVDGEVHDVLRVSADRLRAAL